MLLKINKKKVFTSDQKTLALGLRLTGLLT